MDQKLTNQQILGRLRSEFKGWRVESSRRGDMFEITAPNGRVVRRRFDEVRSPVALQAAVQEMRRQGARS